MFNGRFSREMGLCSDLLCSFKTSSKPTHRWSCFSNCVQLAVLVRLRPFFRGALETAHWGRLGFDGGDEIKGACREGSDSRKSIAATFIVANEDNYALAA